MWPRGQGRDQTIIDAGYNGCIFQMNDDDSVIEDLTMLHGKPVHANGGGALNVIHSCNTTFRNCDFRETDGTGFYNGVIDCGGSNSFMLFESCRFLDNFGGNKSCVYGGFSTARFVNCLFAGNSESVATIRTNETLEVINSTFVDNTTNYAVERAGSTVTNCAFDDSCLLGAISGASASRSLFPGATGDNIDDVPTFTLSFDDQPVREDTDLGFRL